MAKDCTLYDKKVKKELISQLMNDYGLDQEQALQTSSRLFEMNGYRFPVGDKVGELMNSITIGVTASKMNNVLLVAGNTFQSKHESRTFMESKNKFTINSLYERFNEHYHTHGGEVEYHSADGKHVFNYTRMFAERDENGLITADQEFAIKKRIESEIIPILMKGHQDMISNIIKWVNHGSDPKMSKESYFSDKLIEHIFGDTKITPEYLRLLKSTMGIGSASMAYNVNDFITNYGKKLGLNIEDYNDGSFDLDNVIVVAHNGIEQDNTLFSLYTLSPTSLDQQGIGMLGKTLFHNFIPFNNHTKLSTDFKTGLSYGQLDMPNTVGELERFKLSMLGIAMAQKMTSATLKNVAVLKEENMTSTPKISTRWTSMNTMRDRFKILSTISTFTSILVPRLQQVFKDSNTMDQVKTERDFLIEFEEALLTDYEVNTPGVERSEYEEAFTFGEDIEAVSRYRLAQAMGEVGDEKELRYVLNKTLNILNEKRNYTKAMKDTDPLYRAASMMRSRINTNMKMEHGLVHTTITNILTSVQTAMENPILQKLVAKYHDVMLKTARLFNPYREAKIEIMDILNDSYVKRSKLGVASRATETVLAQPWDRITPLKYEQYALDQASGKLVKQWMHRIHHTMTDTYTAALVKRGDITKQELKAGTKIVSLIKSNMLLVLTKKLRYSNPTWSQEAVDKEANRIYTNNWSDGLLPVMLKSTSQYIGEGKLVEALQRMFIDSRFDIEVGEMAILGDTMSDERTAMSLFFNQYSTEGNRYFGSNNRIGNLGIMMPENNNELLKQLKEQEPGEYEYHKNSIIPVLMPNYNELMNTMLNTSDKFSSDIEKVLDHFVADSLFKAYMDTEAIPYYNDLVIEINYEVGNAESKLKDVLLEGASRLTSRNVERKNPTVDKDDKMMQNLSTGLNLLYRATSASAIMASVPVAITSLMANETENIKEMIARSIANPKHLYTAKDDMEAIVFNASHLMFIEAMFDHYAVFNRSLEDRLRDSRNKMTNHSFMTTTYGHIAAFATDYQSRSRAMTAQMIYDGSLEAHTNDMGKITYNKKKDKRYWTLDKNLNYTQSNDQRLLYEDHIAELKRDDPDNEMGVFDVNGDPTVAYTLHELRRIVKLGDDIVGSFGSENSILLRDNIVAYLAFQFKNFLPTKIAQRFGKEKTSEVYMFKQVMEMPDGTRKVVEQEVHTYGTITKAAKYLARYAKESVATHSLTKASKMTEDEKYAMASSAIDIMILGTLGTFLALVNLSGEDKDKKISNLMAINVVASAIKGFNSYTILNPLNLMQMFGELPVLGTAKRMYKMITGQGAWSDLRRSIPGGGSYKMYTDIVDYIDKNNDINE